MMPERSFGIERDGFIWLRPVPDGPVPSSSLGSEETIAGVDYALFIETEFTDDQRSQVRVTAQSFGMTEEELVIKSAENKPVEVSPFAAVQAYVRKLNEDIDSAAG